MVVYSTLTMKETTFQVLSIHASKSLDSLHQKLNIFAKVQ